MTIFTIVRKSLRHHLFSTLITSFSIALAGALLMAVWSVKEQSRQTFTGVNAGFDAVLGARSSKLQLVLNSIFHLEESPGNISWTDYEDIKRNPGVELAVPIAVGDNYLGYRLVGTTHDFFKAQYVPNKQYAVTPPGRVFEENLREAVVGSFVAQRLRLRIGDKFQPYHGLNFDKNQQHAETYVIVGILEPSNTPADRVIWIPLAGIQRMSGHDIRAATDVSAVLIKLKAAAAGRMMSITYNQQGNRLTLAWPVALIMAQLFDKISWIDRVLELVAYLVALVATGSVLASIYNSMNERRREIAILRALGARRSVISGSVVMEAAGIATLGMLIGFVFYFGILSVVASVIRAQTGVVLNPFAWHPVLILAPLGMIGLSALAGLIPAVKAYRTDVAENLVPVS